MNPTSPPRPAWRRAAGALLPWFLAWMVVDRTVRAALIHRFFRRETRRARSPVTGPPPPTRPHVQPILSGDPHLADNLRANARLATALPLRWLWLVDADDGPGRRLTERLLDELAQTAPAARARVELRLAPPAPERVNPKTFKLRLAWESLPAATRENGLFGVLDDDTRLGPGDLETAVGALRRAPGVGLVCGLPYYLSFGTRWSALVSTFVNRHSLWSYLPILQVGPPLTINGMFWLARGAAVAALDGFRAVEGFVCDDYAVARGVRAAGYGLQQTAIVHPLRTGVADARAYDRLLTRWFVFPQVSLLRHEPRRRLVGFVALVFLPAFQCVGALALAAAAGRGRGWVAVLAAQAWREAWQVDLERRYLPGAAGRGREFWRRRALGWVVDLIFPGQILRAFLAPREIVWRGHRLRLDPDGRFEYVARRQGTFSA